METNVDTGLRSLSKKGKLGKEDLKKVVSPPNENIVEKSKEEAEDDELSQGGRFYTHRNSLYKDRQRKGSNWPRVKFDRRGSSDDYSGMDRSLDSIKMNILNFQRKVDLKAHLELKRKRDKIFYISRYYEKKIKLVVVEFTDYVMV